MSIGAWIVVVAVVVAFALGGYRLLTDGRFRGTRALDPGSDERLGPDDRAADPAAEGVTATTWSHVATALPQASLGERATLLQFSSAFCAPCRATRRTLGEVAELVPGVTHIEVDAEHHLEIVRTLGILRTPTTLVLDSAGREVTRASGAPRKEQVLAALGWA